MPRWLRIASTAWFVGLLLLPATLYVLGARQAPIRSRPVAKLPLLVEPSRYATPEFYAELDRYVRERLPLRTPALEARYAIFVGLFHDSPSPFISVGRRDWLFHAPELRGCIAMAAPLPDALSIVGATLQAAGRRPVIAQAGSKTVQELRLAPRQDQDALRCQQAQERRVAERLRSVPGGIDLASTLGGMSARGERVFLQRDTHWAAVARMEYIRLVLDGVRPGLADQADLRFGWPLIDRPADLARVLDVDRGDFEPPVVPARRVTDPPRGVLVIGDSQSNFALREPVGVPPSESIFQGPLRGAGWCHITRLGSGACDEQLRKAKTVVAQSSVRVGDDYVKSCGTLVSVVGSRLSGEDAAWRPRAGGADATTLPMTGQPQTASIAPAGADRTPYPRLFAIRLAALPRGGRVVLSGAVADGRPLPCARRRAARVSDTLMVPLPAGRSANSLAVQLAGTPGVVLGPPTEIALRGNGPKP